jgi:basic membrane protein A
MSRKEAVEQYLKASKLGQKQYKSAVLQGKYPYLPVLDEFLDESLTAGRVDLGLVEIPTERIVGTKDAGRKTAFSPEFMPLMPQGTEFASKWIALCEAHLGPEGIRDYVRCVEYLGRFYVQEGNKRVSVLKSFDAPTITGHVVRILPADSDDEEVRAYYAFLKFYRLAKIYQVRFRQPESYARLQAALGFEPDHVWTDAERSSFLAGFYRFREMYLKGGGREISVTTAGALLVWLRVYTFQQLRDMSAPELTKSLETVMPDVRLLEKSVPIAISTAPEPADKSFISHLLPHPNHVDAAFFYVSEPEKSTWTFAHEQGRRELEKALGDCVSAKTYLITKNDDAEAVMEQAIADGAKVLFATAPTLMDACRKIAVRHKEVKLLNCSLSMPYTGVRTYYGRIYEGKFITGAVAGAMAQEDRVGYVANYPIFGVPASINAFALGVRMTNPRARIELQWSCVPGDPIGHFREKGIRVVSNREAAGPDNNRHNWGMSTSQVLESGELRPLVSACWNWGGFYTQIIRTILDGGWDDLNPREDGRAVNYWWGMDSGVVGLSFGRELPESVARLAEILQRGIERGWLEPFHCPLKDQSGQERSDGSRWLSPEEILNMDWLLDCVDGAIPAFDELLPVSKETVRLLGLYRDSIPPEKEGVIL